MKQSEFLSSSGSEFYVGPA